MTDIEHIRATGDGYRLRATRVRGSTRSHGSWIVEENVFGIETVQRLSAKKLEQWCGLLVIRGARMQNTAEGLYIQCGDELGTYQLCAVIK